MKRSKGVRTERFVKHRQFYKTSLLFTGLMGVSLFLFGCDDSGKEKRYLDRPYTDEYDCYKNSDLTLDKCKKLKGEAETDVKENGKKYNSEKDCKSDNPDYDCKSYTNSSGYVHYYPYPRYFGNSVTSGTGQAYFSNGKSFYTNTGQSFNAKVNTSPRTYTVQSVTPYSSSTGKSISAAKAPTVARGGFGGTAHGISVGG